MHIFCLLQHHAESANRSRQDQGVLAAAAFYQSWLVAKVLSLFITVAETGWLNLVCNQCCITSCCDPLQDIELVFMGPKTGKYDLVLQVMSDCWVGADVSVPVSAYAILIKHHTHLRGLPAL
jgi:hypothetical protein